MLPGSSTPTRIALRSIVFAAKPRIGLPTTASKFVATPLLNPSFFQAIPSCAAMIEPPETDATRVNFCSQPVSLNRRRTPR